MAESREENEGGEKSKKGEVGWRDEIAVRWFISSMKELLVGINESNRRIGSLLGLPCKIELRFS